ncbi:MAG: hypothetical protein JEZ08_22395 [Clostridiales bacterium]|nr:hypothetical protein [Clostridiales bacterium]
MFQSDKHYSNFRKLRKLTDEIYNKTSNRIDASNFILSSDYLCDIAEYVVLTENNYDPKELSHLPLNHNQNVMLYFANEIREDNDIRHQDSYYSLSELQTLPNDSFQVILNSFKILREGTKEYDKTHCSVLNRISCDLEFSNLNEITIKDAMEILIEPKGYLYQTLNKFQRFSSEGNMAEIKNTIYSGRVKSYRGIGDKRVRALKQYIETLEDEVIRSSIQ